MSVPASQVRSHWKVGVASLVGAALVAGCVSGPLYPSGNLDVWPEGPVWMDDGWIYAIDTGLDMPSRLIRFKQDVAPEVIDLPVRDCESPDVEALSRVSANVIAVAAHCVDTVSSDLFVWDLRTASVQRSTRFEALYTSVDDMTWTPDLSMGYVADTLCEGTVLKVEKGAVVRFTESVTVDGATWSLDRGLVSDDRLCFSGGLAVGPFLSGSFLYLGASGQALGLDDFSARQSAPTPIVRMAIPEGPVSVVADGFTNVLDLAVSPDGTLLAVVGERGGPRTCWLVDLDSGQITDLGVPVAESVSISPSGDQAVITAFDADAEFRDLR